MTDLTIIVPLVEYKDELAALYKRSIDSVFAQDSAENISMIFVGPTSSIKHIKDNFGFGARDVLFIENNKNLEPQYQINKAVKDVKTTYFSVLEFDDTYTNIWFKEVERYAEYQEETALFLPLVEVFDAKNPNVGAVGYANEPVWAASFSDEMGYVDNGCLKTYFDFLVSGGVFRKSDFLAVGGLKNSLKVFFWYELLLRMTHNDKRVFVIPKVGYEHYVNVDNSLTEQYRALEPAEVDFWFKTAQDEHIYKTDRKKSYAKDSENNDAN